MKDDMPVTTETYEHQVTLIKQDFTPNDPPPTTPSPPPSPITPVKTSTPVSSTAKSPIKSPKVVLIQQRSPIQCNSSYLRMLRGERTEHVEPVMNQSGEIPTISYPFGSCICLVCGTMFTSASGLMDHQEKCLGDNLPVHLQDNHRESKACTSEEKTCPVCKGVYVSDKCKHCQQAPQLTLVQHQEEYDDRITHANNTTALGFRNNNEICPLPPPPQTDPHKPLPYRIDFLLESGVIKHARINNRKNGAVDSSPLYFENKRPRKPRTHFTIDQVDDLEKVFVDKKYLSVTERSTLAFSLGLQEEQVKNWFQNRRSRWRKDVKLESPQIPSQIQSQIQSQILHVGVPHYSQQYPRQPDSLHGGHDEVPPTVTEFQSPPSSPTIPRSSPDITPSSPKIPDKTANIAHCQQTGLQT